MKRILRVLLLFIVPILCAPTSFATLLTPSNPIIKTDGPLLISSYSFQGQSIRYVQIYNASSKVVSLDGWKLLSSTGVGMHEYDVVLTGMVAPKKFVTVAYSLVMSNATFQFNTANVGPHTLQQITLRPPPELPYLDHSIAISFTSSTPRDSSVSPAIFFFQRNISTSTGSYLSTFTATAQSPSSLYSDELYQLPGSPALSIVEIYSGTEVCAPTDTSSLCLDYVKLYNYSPSSIDLGTYRIRTGSLGQSSNTSNTIAMAGIVGPGEYIIFSLTLSSSGSWVWLEDMYGLELYSNSVIQFPSSSGHANHAWSLNPTTNLWQWTSYPTPNNVPNQFSQDGSYNSCTGLKLSEIAANVDQPYIEIYNATDNGLDISGCQIQTNRSNFVSYVFPAGTILEQGSFFTVMIQGSGLSLTKTTTGIVYVLSSDGASEVDSVTYSDLAENTSYSLFEAGWLQTFTSTPGSPNIYSEYAACQDGYERNFETGRCNKIIPIQSISECEPGQYRSLETNRCRSLRTVGVNLTPCRADEYRNTDTNRCRSLITAAADLKPCATNQERNPETNRCRNVSTDSVLGAASKPEIQTIETHSPTAWLAFTGVTSLAVGYGLWEWRRELHKFIRGIIDKLPL